MFRLAEVLAHRAWLRRTQPFPHIVASHVFNDSFYGMLEAEYTLILGKGLHDAPENNKGNFSRSIAGYDAYGVGFHQGMSGSLSIFASREWHDLLASLFNIPATGHVNVGAHHHAIDSANGWVHNDFNPAWFPRQAMGPIRFPDPLRCAYKTGAGSLPTADKLEVVRAVAMIFYLSNGGWTKGNGGETGLYSSASASPTDVHTRVSPENNSILIFECTPNSFHTFLSNSGRPRNSVIMWIHRSKKDALARWPEKELESWRA